MYFRRTLELRLAIGKISAPNFGDKLTSNRRTDYFYF